MSMSQIIPLQSTLRCRPPLTLSLVPDPLKDSPAADDENRVQAARILRPRRLVISAALAACAAIAAAVALGSSGEHAAATPVASKQQAPGELPPLKSHPKVVRAVGPGEAPPADGVSAGNGTVRAVQSDEEIRGELDQFRRHLTG